jgi:hypothetical protein
MTSVALNLLPYFASDYPDFNKKKYYQMYCKWNYYIDKVREIFIDEFCRGDEEMT